MITFNTNTEQFRPVLDRNGTKIHIGEKVIIKQMSKFTNGTVCGFSDDYRYVYIVGFDFYEGCEKLYKRYPNNVVIVRQLDKWY